LRQTDFSLISTSESPSRVLRKFARFFSACIYGGQKSSRSMCPTHFDVQCNADIFSYSIAREKNILPVNSAKIAGRTAFDGYSRVRCLDVKNFVIRIGGSLARVSKVFFRFSGRFANASFLLINRALVLNYQHAVNSKTANMAIRSQSPQIILRSALCRRNLFLLRNNQFCLCIGMMPLICLATSRAGDSNYF